ncbi:hypothetical protein LRH25_20130 [Ideonella azotifigens]|uniref:DUF4145 domain-containing protein n=1 Tax=Ideonella azotifigens TaxID=513160 RepID=A0ABN1JZS3_9BURK|nr:hypothetical protein [Ideonella azotifigens]MCD2342639.1 hypothetical protein [Ideonella azotifigens]
MNTDFIYWTFTAAAQCVSTFVALLLTGYALVLSQIESARDRDDSLQDIHDALRMSYHSRLTWLAWLTAIAVVLSLLVVWVNRANIPPPDALMGGAAFMDTLAIVAGLAFVVTIIDPRKYQKAAERELEQQAQLKEGEDAANRTPSTEFFRVYRKLERSLRDLAMRQGMEEAPTEGRRGSAAGSLRQVAETLIQHEVISEELYSELQQIIKYRNLLFHGHVKEANFAMVERARHATGKLKAAAKHADHPARTETN